MNIMNLSEFRRLSVEEVPKVLPVVIAINGEPAYIIEKTENVICLGDLHPRVQTQLRAQERRARVGMPLPQKLWAEDVRKIAEPEIPELEKHEVINRPPKIFV